MVAQIQQARQKLPLDNKEAARRLEQAAHALDEQGVNLFRVRAYRIAAETLRRLSRPAAAILEEGGRKALKELPGIGPRLALALEELLRKGRLPQLEAQSRSIRSSGRDSQGLFHRS